MRWYTYRRSTHRHYTYHTRKPRRHRNPRAHRVTQKLLNLFYL